MHELLSYTDKQIIIVSVPVKAAKLSVLYVTGVKGLCNVVK